MVELRDLRHEGIIPLGDFVEYWSASHAFMEGRNPYSPEVLLEIQRTAGSRDPNPLMMWNPPWTLPLLLPFSQFSYWLDRGFWYLFNLLMIFAIADWLWQHWGGPRSRRWISWLATLFFIPAGTALFLGQISPLLLAGLCGFLWALEKKRLYIAGICLLLLAVKPHVLYLFWVFLLLWLIKERRWTIFWGGLSAIAFSSLIAVLIHPHVFIDFWQSVSSPSGPMIWQTPTWGVALQMLFPDLPAHVQFAPCLIGFFASYWLWRAWKQSFNWKRHLPPIILLSVTTSSFTWPFDWIVLLPIVILVLIWFQDNPARRWWLLAGLTGIVIGTLIQPFIVHNYFHGIWLPPALFLVYLAGAYANAPLGEGFSPSRLSTRKDQSQ